MSVDPLAEKYNWQTNYAFGSNQVVHSRELEGLEAYDDLDRDDLDYSDHPVYGTDLFDSNGNQIHDPEYALNEVIIEAHPIDRSNDEEDSYFQDYFDGPDSGEYGPDTEFWDNLLTPDNLQDLGDGLTLLGLGLTSTGFLAEIGVPLAALGETISAVGTAAEHIGNIVEGDFVFSDLVIDLGLNFIPDAYEKTFSTTVDEFGDVIKDVGLDNLLIEAWSMGSDRWIDFMNETNNDRMTTP